MLGRAVLTCDIDERWNGPPPRCEPIECEAPPELENGEIIAANGTMFGARAELICDEGYRLTGETKTILCSGIGQWSEPLASCMPDSGLTEDSSEEEEGSVQGTTTAPQSPVPTIPAASSASDSNVPTTNTISSSSSSSSAAPTRASATLSTVGPSAASTPSRTRVSGTSPAVRRPTRPSTRYTTVISASPTRPSQSAGHELTNVNDLDDDDTDDEEDMANGDDRSHPGTILVTMTPRPPNGSQNSRPHIPLNGHANNSPPPLIKGQPPTGTILQKETVIQRTNSNNNGHQQTTSSSSSSSTTSTTSRRVPPLVVAITTTTAAPTTKKDAQKDVIQAAHPQDNEIASSVNIRYEKYSICSIF